MPLRGLQSEKGAEAWFQTRGVRWVAEDDLGDDSNVAVYCAGVSL